ncbi:MAG: HAMP domain-containing histidine kinase [Candidatus Woesebacteria bacterium]|nr:MAG: HAMP domain-containing histidine kinase [Candidatus Woesebacteria bacterium]
MFNSARLKLTAWYLLIIMVISCSFSVVIYRSLVSEIDRIAAMQRSRVERRFDFGLFPQQIIDPEIFEETKRRILLTLGFINGAIFVISGGTGFLLAGRTLSPIAAMMDEQNRFVSDASHEFRTPLTSLKIAMEVYLREKKHTLQETKSLITESIVEVNKLQSLSDSLLQLTSHRQNGKTEFRKQSLKKIIDTSLHKVSSIASQKEIKITTNINDYKISCDQESLVQLLVVVLDNAIKYSTEKSKVIVSSKKIDGSVLIQITDFGIGIKKSDIAHIFDRFYRADSARSKVGSGGYGLGLSIAKKIVEDHKGSINVKSEPNKGSTFSILLPI